MAAVQRVTGLRLGNRQVSELATRAAADVDQFYLTRDLPDVAGADVLALPFDGKGIVMRPDALREATAKAATSQKLSTRLPKGEKRNRKRMAEVGAVYEVIPAPRTRPTSSPRPPLPPVTPTAPQPGPPGPNCRHMAHGQRRRHHRAGHHLGVRRGPTPRPRPRPDLDRPGRRQQPPDRPDQTHAQARRISVTIIIDFIHVRYVWKAAWCFHTEGDPKAEQWVADKAREILSGNAGLVAAAIRRTATRRALTDEQRRNADTAADYLHNKKKHLNYPTALAAGWPIATGVIEGACRHLVKDRMDVTGARWGLDGAEAILKLRALTSNGNFNTYWTHHQQQEQLCIHNSRYWNDQIPK